MKDCIFCKMRDEKVHVDKIWEDKKFFCILDQVPIVPGHMLIIPKKHTDDIFYLNKKEYLELMIKSREVAKKLRKKLRKKIGMFVEGLGVNHIHVHLIPLNRGIELYELDSKKRKKADSRELNKIAEKIRE